MMRLLLFITILASAAALWAANANDDPTAAVIAEHNGRVGGYMADYAKRAALARDSFEKSAAASGNLAVKKLEDLAARSIRGGDLKGAGASYRQILRLDINHKKARGYFESLEQLDKVLAEVKADPLSISAPAGPSSDGEAEAWKTVLRLDRTHRAARQYFTDRGDLRKVLVGLDAEPREKKEVVISAVLRLVVNGRDSFTVVLMANGRVNYPESTAKWSLSDGGQTLRLHWSSTIDSVRLDAMRKKFSGGNNKGARIAGDVRWGSIPTESPKG